MEHEGMTMEDYRAVERMMARERAYRRSMGLLAIGAYWALVCALALLAAVALFATVGAWAQEAELVPVTEAQAADAAKAPMKPTLLSGAYDPGSAQAVVDATMITAAEAANAKLDERDRKPLVIKTDTDQWPYITYLKAEQDCRFTNETLAGQVDTPTTAQLRLYPDGKAADYVDAKAGDVVEVIPHNPHVTPNDSGPRPVIYVVVPCR